MKNISKDKRIILIIVIALFALAAGIAFLLRDKEPAIEVQEIVWQKDCEQYDYNLKFVDKYNRPMADVEVCFYEQDEGTVIVAAADNNGELHYSCNNEGCTSQTHLVRITGFPEGYACYEGDRFDAEKETTKVITLNTFNEIAKLNKQARKEMVSNEIVSS